MRSTSLCGPSFLFLLGLAACGGTGQSSDTSRTSPGAGATRDDGTGSSGTGATDAPTGASGSGTGNGNGDGKGPEEPEPPGDPDVQLIGRFDMQTGKPLCAWPGCRVIARFSGTAVSARMNEHDETWMEGAPSEWSVLVDGKETRTLVMKPGDGTYELAAGLPDGKHVVELYKRSEAQNGATEFLGYDFHGGKLLAPPVRKSRRIEIVGDSAASGFGVEGVGEGPDCPGPDWASRWQDYRKSFGARLGDTLDAEVMGTVYSGKGIAKNIWHPDKETMPILFSRANPLDTASTWDFSKYVPDAVVVMMGGNDFAIGQPVDEGPATLAAFADAYDGFVRALRGKYAGAHVFLVVSPSVSDAEPEGRSTRTNVKAGVAEVVSRRAGDAKVHAIEPPVAQPGELTGCNGHGSPAYHVRVAADLAGPMKTSLGW